MLKKLRGRISNLSLSAKRNVALVLTAAMVVVTCGNFTFPLQNRVTIAVEGSVPVSVTTTDTNVGKILSKQGIVLNEGDEVNYLLTDEVSNDAVIEIYRSMDVNVAYMGETKQHRTTKSKVEDILHELGIKVDAGDSVEPSLETTVENGSTIKVTLYDNHNVFVHEDIAYNTQEIENPDLAAGERKVVQAGKKGVLEYEYKVQYQDGVEV